VRDGVFDEGGDGIHCERVTTASFCFGFSSDTLEESLCVRSE
jgi:hypothetical protein